MATLDEAARLASALPDVTEGRRYGNRTWFVAKKGFAWERPLTRADVERFGAEPVPEGPIFAVRVDDLAEKEAVIEAGAPAVFTIPHFDGYAAVLIRLDEVTEAALAELVEDAWLACAPAALVARHLEGDGDT